MLSIIIHRIVNTAHKQNMANTGSKPQCTNSSLIKTASSVIKIFINSSSVNDISDLSRSLSSKSSQAWLKFL